MTSADLPTPTAARASRRPGPRRAAGLPTGPEEVRSAVIAAAAELFSREGVSEVSLRQIAAAAQVNPALISRYIGSRDDLVRAVFADLTDRLVDEITTAPSASRGFDPDTVMGQWTRVLTHLVLTDIDTAIEIGRAPVEVLSEAVEGLYDQDRAAARLRVAQLMGSAIGWRLFEPYLVAAAGIDSLGLDDVRAELTRTHRRLAATPFPSPSDPPERPTSSL